MEGFDRTAALVLDSPPTPSELLLGQPLLDKLLFLFVLRLIEQLLVIDIGRIHCPGDKDWAEVGDALLGLEPHPIECFSLALFSVRRRFDYNYGVLHVLNGLA